MSVAVNGRTEYSLDGGFLMCQVCESEFRGPRLLTCLHSFCGDCLETSLDRGQIAPGQAFFCPLCRTRCLVPARGVRDMAPNSLATALMEFLRSKESPEVDGEVECGGCGSRSLAKKCIECGDWLCEECCALHVKVKLTKDHHISTVDELQNGKYDELIKDGLESSLLCSKHGEPLRYFCEESTCRIPICHLCKMTSSHDSHSTVTLSDQAVTEARRLRDLLPNLDRCIRSAETKLNNLAQDEKMTSHVRRQVHRSIFERTERVIQGLVEAVQKHADRLHQTVEDAVQLHRGDVTRETEVARNQLEAAKTAKVFAETLVWFNRPEDLLTLGDRVCSRLMEFQVPLDSMPPPWKKPRMEEVEENPEIDSDVIEAHFGALVFEGDVIKTVTSTTFSARIDEDDAPCKLCDVTVDGDGDVIVADRDNRSVKVFTPDGRLRLSTRAKGTFKAPNRVAVLQRSRRIAVKDGRFVRLITYAGEVVGSLGDDLKQPVAITESDEGEIYVTEWMGGEVVVFESTGRRLRSFPCSCEAPGYISCSANGNIVLTDWKRHVVRIFDRRGKLRAEYGEYGSGDGQLDHPYGVCTDRWNNIIVCDTWNNRIVLLSPEGIFMKVILSKTHGLEWPQAVTVDRRTGQLVIAEQYGMVKFYKYVT